MNLHDLRPARGSKKRRRRVARGNAGRGGTYAGRGRKGQLARSGGGKAPYFEGGQLPLVRRLPYRRGFKNPFRVHYTAVNLGALDERFEEGAEVTPTALVAAGLLRRDDQPYKVLAEGALTKRLVVHAPRISAPACKEIERLGGECVYLPDEHRRPGMGRRRKR